MLFRRLLQTADDYTLTMVRAVLGVIFFAHGAQKVFGWFGGPGFDGTMVFFTQNLGIPAFFAVLAILAESLGSLGLIFGLLSRIAAFGITIVMAVAVFLVHAPNGFFMNWAGNQKGEGFEFHLLVLAMSLLIMVRGAGASSLDRILERWLEGGATLHTRMEPEHSH
jgi:putative oxidoreductase